MPMAVQFLMIPEEIHHQRGNQRPGENVGGEHRKNHSLGQRHEEETRHARQEKHRHENNADAQGRDKCRRRRSERRHRGCLRGVSFPPARFRSMFSMVTVASSTRMPTASARPPRVMILIVSPRALRITIALRIESGIEIAITTVLRQFPRKRRIIAAVRHAAMTASLMTPSTAARTKSDWSKSGWMRSSGGRPAAIRGQRRLHLADDVERGCAAGLVGGEQRAALAVLAHDVGLHLESVADVRDVAHVNHRAVDGLDRQVVQGIHRGGLPFSSTLYSRLPTFTVPLGITRFWALTAFAMSVGESPYPLSLLGSISTMTWRILPP